MVSGHRLQTIGRRLPAQSRPAKEMVCLLSSLKRWKLPTRMREATLPAL
jgi:hypothetical protein